MNLIILAGGKSSRFGQDKAFIKFENIPIIERIFSAIGSLFGRVIISANNLEKYAHLKARVVVDEFKGVGPLGGIYSALKASDSVMNFVVGCDMPLIYPEVVLYLINLNGSDAVVPIIAGFPEPLMAAYSKSCLPAIKEMIEKKRYKISQLYSKVKTRFVPEIEIRRFDPELLTFTNINTMVTQRKYERKSRNCKI